MSITAAEVNKLRKQTGAGMMDCKKALQEAEGDFDKAIEILRLKGQKVAAKRGDRETGEGAVISSANAAGDFGVLAGFELRNRLCCQERGICWLWPRAS